MHTRKTSAFIRSEPGYDVWEETSSVEFTTAVISDPDGTTQDLADEIAAMSGEPVTCTVARTRDGAYIGDLDTAEFLTANRGIAPELTRTTDRVCSIGFCAREQKWYGWSHRAIYGFGVGDVLKEGDCATSSGWTDEYLAAHPEEDVSLPVGFTAKTLDDAKRMAIAFAESVG